MRTNSISPVSPTYDRRSGRTDRRASAERRQPKQDRRRARHAATPWLSATFATQIITQCLFDDSVSPQTAQAAYAKANKAR